MLQVWFRALAVSGLIAILIHATAPVTEAQVDEAYKVHYQNAKRLVPMMVDAAQAEKGREFRERSDEFKLNIDMLQDKLERAGSGLHENDRKWYLGETTSDKVIDKCKKVRIAAGSIQTVLGELKSPSSEISNLKSEWSELADAMEKLWDDFQKRGKLMGEKLREIDERMKAFQNVCRGCF